MVSSLDSKAQFGAADAYVERVGNDLRFKDSNNAAPVTLSDLVSPRRTDTTLLTLIKGAAAYRSPPPELVAVSGSTNTNTIIPAYAFDASTEEYVVYTVQLPTNLETSGSVNIRFQWLPLTASSNNVVWKIYYAPIDSGESFDAAMSSRTVTSAGSATTDVISEAVITDSLTNLGWSAGDNLIIHVSRDATNGSDNLSGDAYLINVAIEAPLKNSGSTASISPAAGASATNLVVTNNSGSANFKMDCTADAIVMADGSTGQNKRYKSFYSVSTTFDITTDLDTGTENSNTWYYLWLYSTDGSTLSRKVSTSATSPTGVTSADFKLRVGAVRNDGSSNFLRTTKQDGKVTYIGDWPAPVSSSSTASPWTSSSISTYVPPHARQVFGVAFVDPGSSGSAGNLAVTGDNTKTASDDGSAGTISVVRGSSSGGGSVYFDEYLKTAQTLYYGSSTTYPYKVMVGGYFEQVY